MRKCHNCSASVELEDRFCGSCGANLGVANEPAAEGATPPRSSQPASGDSPTAAQSKWLKPALIIGAIMAAGLVWLVGNWFEQQNRQSAYGRIADAANAGTRDGGMPENREGSPNRATQRSDALRAGSASDGNTTGRYGGSATPGAPINAGRWLFDWQITSFAGQGQAMPLTPRNSLPFGRTGQQEFCLSEAMASAPGSVAFPIAPEANCTTRDYKMRGGAIAGTFSCNFERIPGPVDAAIEGTYEADSIDVTMRMRMPAAAIATGAYVEEVLDVSYRYQGHRSGGC